ncbi:hypothetical protein [Pseudomonas putida]|uniref:Uncharacterized protein n=1 Tax=Pseudomonas putida TaxID=303 RepID=A0A8I1ECC3_PSEPU|nr:hypothetical protein [Pseudomonas putida]MBI6883190.1 hypothetical protein [Pseudomonas putida]
MACIIAIEGGAVCVGTPGSYESDDERAADEADFYELADELNKDRYFNNLKAKAAKDGFELKPHVSDGDDGCWLVISVGREILPDRYMMKGEVKTLSTELSEEDKANVVKHLTAVENHLRDMGHGTEQQLGIVLNHFD